MADDSPPPDLEFVVPTRDELIERAEKFKANLNNIRLSNNRSVLEEAESNGLAVADLYLMSLQYRPASNWLFGWFKQYQGEWRQVARVAKSMREAADGLRFLAELNFPFARRPDRDRTRLPSREKAELSDPLTDPFKGAATQAAPRATSWPPSSTEIDLPPTAEERGAEWRSPYRVPAELVELFFDFTKPKAKRTHQKALDPTWVRILRRSEHYRRLNAKINRLKRQSGFDWSRRITPLSGDLERIALIFDDFASQTEQIAAQLHRPRGRTPAAAERAFRKEFATYAKRQSGKYLDPIGAALFSLTFYSVQAKEYERLRQLDEQSRGPKKIKKRR